MDLFAHAPAALVLDVPPAARWRLAVRYGIDEPASQRESGDGVCFVVRDGTAGRSGAELFDECLDPRTPAGRQPRSRLVAIPPGTERLVLETNPRATTEWDRSYWSDVELQAELVGPSR